MTSTSQFLFTFFGEEMKSNAQKVVERASLAVGIFTLLVIVVGASYQIGFDKGKVSATISDTTFEDDKEVTTFKYNGRIVFKAGDNSIEISFPDMKKGEVEWK